MFERILYTSRASEHVSMRDVYDIIRKAHNRNNDSGLTGGLLFIDEFFIQVLEGSPYAVEERYRRIMSDPRHQGISLRLRESSPNLLFPSEWMALKSGNDIAPEVFQKHGYLPGLPIEHFDGREVLDFVVDCFASSCVDA